MASFFCAPCILCCGWPDLTEGEAGNAPGSRRGRTPSGRWAMKRKSEKSNAGTLQRGRSHTPQGGKGGLYMGDTKKKSRSKSLSPEKRKMPEKILVTVYISRGYKFVNTDRWNKPDPYVAAYINEDTEVGRTVSRENTCDPTFNSEIKFVCSGGTKYFTLRVWDDDMDGVLSPTGKFAAIKLPSMPSMGLGLGSGGGDEEDGGKKENTDDFMGECRVRLPKKVGKTAYYQEDLEDGSMPHHKIKDHLVQHGVLEFTVTIKASMYDT